MSGRKYAGVLLGMVLSLLLVGGAIAGQKGPTYKAPAWWGWNSEIWAEHANGTSTFYQQYCDYRPSPYVWTIYEVMHHWPFFPSTGLGNKYVYCAYTSPWYGASWTTQSGVDYSTEYHGAYDIYSVWYKIVYPGT